MEPIGPYDLVEEVGRGGMSTVFRARSRATGGEVALKVFSAEFAPAETVLKLTMQLTHPNVVRILDAGAAGARAYVAMEFVNGPAFDIAIRRRAFGPRDTATLVAAVARGLQAAHDRGLVHRDIKPGNILLMSDGTPKLTDFGLAKVGVDDAARQAGVTAGTPIYMSPEQATGMSERVEAKSDVYSLGAVLYEAVTGRAPFGGRDTLEILRRVAAEAPPPPRSAVPDLDPTLEGIILKAMAKDPAHRYATAVSLAEDLERWALGRTVEQPRATQPLPRVRRRLPVVPALIFGFVALIAVTMTSLILLSRSREREAREDLVREALEAQGAGAKEVELARRLLYRGAPPESLPVEVDRAVTTLRRSLALHEFAETHYLMGRAHAIVRRTDDALQGWRRCLAMQPDHAGAALAMARVLSEEQAEAAHDGPAADPQAVREAIVRLERLPDPAARVYVHLLRREYRDAAQRASELSRSRGDEEYAYVAGLAYAAARSHETAKGWLSKAIEACPNFYEARHARGHVLEALGDPAGAAEDYRRAGVIPPPQAQMVAHEAGLLARQGRRAEAIAALDRAIALRPDAHLLHDRGMLREQTGDRAGALADLAKAMEHDPGWSGPWAARAGLRLLTGDVSGAYDDASRALRLNAREAGALLVRAAALVQGGNPRAAMDDYSAAIEANPFLAAAYAGRGRCSLLLAQNANAETDLTRAITMGKPEAWWFLERARARSAMARWEEAIFDADAVIRLEGTGSLAAEAAVVKAEAKRRLEGQ